MSKIDCGIGIKLKSWIVRVTPLLYPADPRKLLKLRSSIICVTASLYIVVIIAGTIAVNAHRAAPEDLFFVASRQLPAGHRLLADDLKPNLKLAERALPQMPNKDALLGRYVVKGVAESQRIELGNLASAPLIVPAVGNVAYFHSLAAQPELTQLLDAGTRVAICGVDECTCAKVLAVICAATTTSCSASLEISSVDAGKLARRNPGENSQLVVRSDQ